MFLVVARQSRTFQLLMLAWAARCTRNWEGTQPGQLTPNDQRDVPYHMMSCSTYKVGGRRRKRKTLGVTVFVFPSNSYA